MVLEVERRVTRIRKRIMNLLYLYLYLRKLLMKLK